MITFFTTLNHHKGWRTEGDPLKDLPPLRPTTRLSLDITRIESEAPKTVTYANEWQTPASVPSATFVPANPPPPPSNFESEWTAFQKGESTQINVLKPTRTYDYSIQASEAPKTVTYENEWFVKNTIEPSRTKLYSTIEPSKTKVYSNYEYVFETRGPGNARVDVVSPYDDQELEARPTTNRAETYGYPNEDDLYTYPEQTKPYSGGNSKEKSGGSATSSYGLDITQGRHIYILIFKCVILSPCLSIS